MVSKLVREEGQDVDEVEAAGNTALHNAAYEGWADGVELLLSLGAKVNASNNAGDTPWHWARNMGHAHVMALLEKVSTAATDEAARECLHTHHVSSFSSIFCCKTCQTASASTVFVITSSV